VAGGTGLFGLQAEEAAGAGKGFFQRYFNRVLNITPPSWLGTSGVGTSSAAAQ